MALSGLRKVRWKSILLERRIEGGVTVSNNFTLRGQNGFTIGTGDKFATHLK